MKRGHIEKRGPRTYRITIYTGRKLPDGSYDRYRETLVGTGTEKEAERQAQQRLRELLVQLDKNRLANPGSMTFSDLLDLWLEDYVEPNGEIRTYESYKAHVEKRIKPELGDIALTKLAPIHISRFYASLQKDGARRDGKPGGLSPATIRRIDAVVRGSLSYAVQLNLIPYNPARDLKLPKAMRAAKRRWNIVQLQKFLSTIKDHPYRPFILTLAFTGARIGEVAALTWNDVDLEGRTITFARALKKPGKNPIIGDTKTHQVRVVAMHDELVPVLKEHKARQNEIRLKLGGTWNPLNLCFVNSAGNPIHKSNFYRDVWKPILETSKLPYINVHGLRHTFATHLIGSGVDPTIVRDMLGHSTVAFTLQEYNTPDQSDQRKALSLFSIGSSR